MSWIWITQITFDLFLVAGMAFWLFDRTRDRSARAANETRLTEALGKVHDHSAQLEDEALHYRKTAEGQLRVLSRICDEAARVFNRTQFSEVSSTPSLEESELRAILKAPATQESKIPTLEQLEKTRRRLDSEINFDLRTLLRDQLS